MNTPAPPLPALLKQLRQAAGMSQADLAVRLCVITGTTTLTRHEVSRWERGRRKPIAWLSALAVALEVELQELEGAVSRPVASPLLDPAHQVDPAHQAAALTDRRNIDALLAADLSHLLAANRRLEDRVGSAAVKEAVTAQTILTTHLATEARGPARVPIVRVAAGWEQFTGWLHASTGDHPKAIAHYRAALELAEEVADRDMVATALSMRGHVAWMAGHIGPMIGLSQAAQRDGQQLSPTTLALNVQQEARGHGIEGNLYLMETGLDRAAHLIATANGHPDAQYFYSPAFLEMQRGMAYRFAATSADQRGDETIAATLFGRAITALEAGMAEFDPETLTSEWATWYVAELAQAYAGVGEPAPAATHARQAFVVAQATRGRRLAQAIADLHADLSARWPDQTAARG